MASNWRVLQVFGLFGCLISAQICGCSSDETKVVPPASEAGAAGELESAGGGTSGGGAANRAGAPSSGEAGAPEGGAADSAGAGVEAASAGAAGAGEVNGEGGSGGAPVVTPPKPTFDVLQKVNANDPSQGLHLGWEDTEACDTVRVERKGGTDITGLYAVVASLPGSTTTYNDTTATNPNYNYVYRLVCVIDGVDSAPSDEIAAMP